MSAKWCDTEMFPKKTDQFDELMYSKYNGHIAVRSKRTAKV